VQVGVGGPTVLVNLLVILAVVQVGSLFSADAWNNITFTAGEVKNPKRNIPLSLILGTGFVLTVYFLVRWLPAGAAHARRPEWRDGDGARHSVCHGGSRGHGGAGADLPLRRRLLMAAAILISTFGCANGMSLAGARVYYAMSQDGLFFKSVGKLHPRYKTPARACWCRPRGPRAVHLRLLQPVAGLHHLRGAGLLHSHHRGPVRAALQAPDAPRPYKALGYPVLPALYIAMAAWICIVLLRYKPQYTWPGLVLVLLGIPVYLFWSRRTASSEAGSASKLIR
jgi:basic amino acid/polyamine antiporter, APA family